MWPARFIPAVLWTAIVLKLLLSESDGVPRFWWLQFPNADKLIHVGLFGVNTALLLYAANTVDLQKYRSRIVAFIALWTLALGAVTELAQHHLLVTRSGDILDLLADAVGGMVPLAWFLLKVKKAD